MALTSTLFTGLSGLNVNQTKLNVTGNNIANANTVAFKSSRALFSPQFYVTDAAGGPPEGEFGGTNPSQRGLGATVATIQKDFTAGALETTGKSTDLAIDGAGFFVIEGEGRKFTRDGSFTRNPDNDLVTTRGDYVMGYGVDDTGTVVKGALQHLNIPLNVKSQAKATEKVTLSGNLDADGPKATGASQLTTAAYVVAGGTPATAATALADLRDPADLATPLFATGDVLTVNGKRGGRDIADLTFTLPAGATVTDLSNFLSQGLQIDTSAEAVAAAPPGFTPGVTIDPTGKLQIIGNSGVENAVELGGTAFTSSNPGFNVAFSAAGTSNPSGESIFTSFEAFDSLGTPVTIDVTAVLESADDAGSTWRFYAQSPENTKAQTFDAAAPSTGATVGTGTLSFDNFGKLTGSTNTTLSLDRSGTGAAPQLNINLDFSSLKALTTSTAPSELVMLKQDGFATGTLNDFGVGDNGLITGSFSNGQTRTLGQLAVATFANNEGLVDQGANEYIAGGNSGDAVITSPLELSAGAVRSGSLELSNVDISKEFINMIIASTGFSAASRVITTSDQLITELLNTGR